MTRLPIGWRALGSWATIIALLLVVLGIEADWSAPRAATAVAPAQAPRPVDPALLPEYGIPGGVEARSETVNRTLFNPTRRPAPTVVQEAPKAQMQRGQFALTGTTVVEGKSTAFLRDVKTNKFHRVHEGDTVNGLRVTEVKPDRVKLAMGDETEELSLKVMVSARPPIIAAPHAAPPAPGMPPTFPGQATPFPGGVPTMAGGVPQSPPVAAGAAAAGPVEGELSAAQQLLERRRAARAQGQVPGIGAGAPNNVRPGTPRAAPRAAGS